MRIILSRKAFDSTAGGAPSPIYPDGAMLPLPIPESDAGSRTTRYADIDVGGVSLGDVVCGLTGGRVMPQQYAHLDPDLRSDALPRPEGWRPMFGQTGAAQGHLRRMGVGPGDVFLYFGWFRGAENAGGVHRYREGAADLHVLYGWLQVGAIHDIAAGAALPAWARAHPHASGRYQGANTVYEAAANLRLPGPPLVADIGERRVPPCPGAGVFTRAADELTLSASPAQLPPGGPRGRSTWRLPRCFLAHDGVPCLSYNRATWRWSPDPTSRDHVLLTVASRGQEFVLDAELHPGVLEWLAGVVERHGRASGTDHARRLLLAVRELHRRGYQRLRIAPGLSPTGSAWRCAIVPAGATCRENGALVPPGWDAEAGYSSAQNGSFFGWSDAAHDSAGQLASRILARFPVLAAAGRGNDAAYAAWYEEMLMITAPTALPYAYWDRCGDWVPGMSHLPTTAGNTVPVPPPGAASYRGGAQKT